LVEVSFGQDELTGTRLGDDLRLAESFCEEDLADSIVDLVRTGVIQVFSPVIWPGMHRLHGRGRCPSTGIERVPNQHVGRQST
jgi:hypothetical protein